MPERRSSRSLRDVSHLFLSESRPVRSEVRHATACVWLAAADASLNRAHLATGLAATFARQRMRVSLLEVCGNLPTIGYYFGMESAEYLSPALDRTALVSGAWNGAVRYFFSASVSSFRGRLGEEPKTRGAPCDRSGVFVSAPAERGASLLGAPGCLCRPCGRLGAGRFAGRDNRRRRCRGRQTDRSLRCGDARGVSACRRFSRGGSLIARGRWV